MVDITKRSVKGSPLTNDEVDDNFDNLNTGKVGVEDIGTDPNQVPLNQYLGSMAYQDLDAVSITGGSIDGADIDGGTIDGVTIGGSSAGAITGTTGQFNTSLNVDGTVTADGADLDGAVVINESGADVDFRVESTSSANMLFVDASLNRVGIGTGSPDTTLEVNGTVTVNGTTGGVVRIQRQDGAVFPGDTLGTIEFYTNDLTNPGVSAYIKNEADNGSVYSAITFGTGLSGSVTEAMRINSGGFLTNQSGAVFNESGADSDFRVESDGNTHALFVDAGNDRVGVGTSSPSELLGFPYGGISSGTVQVLNAAVVEIPELTTKGAYFIIVRGSDSRQPVAIFTATKVDDTATGSITKLEESAGISFWAGKVWSLTWPAGDKPKLSHNYVGTIDARYIVFGIRM